MTSEDELDNLDKNLRDASLVERLEKRAAIRRQISTRKSVQEGKPDKLANLLEEAATRIKELELKYEYTYLGRGNINIKQR